MLHHSFRKSSKVKQKKDGCRIYWLNPPAQYFCFCVLFLFLFGGLYIIKESLLKFDLNCYILLKTVIYPMEVSFWITLIIKLKKILKSQLCSGFYDVLMKVIINLFINKILQISLPSLFLLFPFFPPCHANSEPWLTLMLYY